MKARTLRINARAAAKARGHDMGNFAQVRVHAKHPAWSAQCKRCHVFLNVNHNPYPGEATLSGSALVFNCTKEKV
jgi:hypothetical protein